MNWYNLIMGEENRLPQHLMVDEAEFLGRDWLTDFTIGQRIQDWNQEQVLRSTQWGRDRMPDDILANAFQLPIFSQRLQEALLQSAIGMHDLQYLPIRVETSVGEELTGFAIANIVSLVPALASSECFMLSVDASEVDPRTGEPKITGIGKAALEAELLPGHDVIRLVEYCPLILVSERFERTFTANNFTGAAFNRVRVVS